MNASSPTWVHRIQILKLKYESESSEFLIRLWKSRSRNLGFWLFISLVGLRHLSLLRNLCLWTWATKALRYTHIFHRRTLAFPCFLWFMLSTCLRAFLAWSLKNISPEAKFSTAACHGGGREGDSSSGYPTLSHHIWCQRLSHLQNKTHNSQEQGPLTCLVFYLLYL